MSENIPNYFDLVTHEELIEHYGEAPDPEEVSRSRTSFANDPDLNLQYLYWLYLDRGDEKTAEHYFSLIQDAQRKLDAAASAGDAGYF